MNQRVFVVDDDWTVRNMIAGILAKSYEVVTAASGEEALALAVQEPPGVVLLDIIMPGIDGLETCRRLKGEFPEDDIQVIIVSGASSGEEQARAFALGADAYLVKPFDPYVLLSEIRLQFRLRETLGRVSSIEDEMQSHRRQCQRLIEDQNRQTVAMQDFAVFALAQVAESRDDDTGNHMMRVRGYAQTLAQRLQQRGPYAAQISRQFLADLHRASPLHDIGKMAISDTILLKPGKLTPAEFEAMKMHTVIGAQTLQRVVSNSDCGRFLAMAVAVAKSHHERFDGNGYPEGLRGEQIPLPARIVALADVFDAITSQRPYKPAYPVAHARHLIHGECGTHFDPLIVEAFDGSFGEFMEIAMRYGNSAAGTPPRSDSHDAADSCSPTQLAATPG